MDDTIKVHIVDKGRGCLYMRFRDPVTGKDVTRSTGKSSKKEALKVAGEWESQLREGRYKPASKITWAEFRQRYEDEALTALADRTAIKVGTTFEHIEELISPARLADLTAERLSTWQTKLREKGLAEDTIKGYVAHLKSALTWAAEMGMIHQVPKIRTPQRTTGGGKVMKGRPITAEEFDRMLDAVPKGSKVAPGNVEGWRFLLRGLWASGLRISEAMELSWDRPGMMIDLTGRRPMLAVLAGSEKGHKSRLLPLAPEAAELFLSVPEAQRTGYVFNPRLPKGGRPPAKVASAVITSIGEKAMVKVDESIRKGQAKTKWASAHDCRRAFGLRWATRVMPPVLQQLMRHSEIETTLRFYVGTDAEAMGEVIYAAMPKGKKGDSEGDSAVLGSSEKSTEGIVP